MIVCNHCGTHNPDDTTFCGQCGSFLEWEGTRLAAPEIGAPPEPEAEPEAEVQVDGQHKGIVRRVRQAVRHEGEGGVAPPAFSSPAGSSPAGSSPAGSSTAGSSTAGSSPEGSSPAGPPPVLAPGEDALAEPVGLDDGLPEQVGQPPSSVANPPRLVAVGESGEPGGWAAVEGAPERAGGLEGRPTGAAAALAGAAGAAGAMGSSPSLESPREADPALVATPPGGTPVVEVASPGAEPPSVAARRPTSAASRAAPSLAVPTIAGTPVELDDDRYVAGAQGLSGQPSAQQPSAQQPSAVKPALVAERPRHTQVRQLDEPVARPGDLICERCAFPNDPQRTYCRRCGLDLQVLVQTSLRWWTRWWRRFVAWLHRNRNEYPDEETEEEPLVAAGAAGGAGTGPTASGSKAVMTKGKGALKKPKTPKAVKGLKKPKPGGQRNAGYPTRGGAPSQILPLLARVGPVLILAAIIAYVVSGTVRKSAGHATSRVANDVRELIAPHYVLQRPEGVTASSFAPQEPPGNAFDEIVGSPWVTAPALGEGAGQSISATFPAGTTVNQIIFSLGTGVAGTYVTQARMHEVQVTLFNSRGKTVRTRDFTLNDTGNPQNVSIKAKHVERATVTILSVYPSLYEASQQTGCATDEIEFFKKA